MSDHSLEQPHALPHVPTETVYLCPEHYSTLMTTETLEKILSTIPPHVDVSNAYHTDHAAASQDS